MGVVPPVRVWTDGPPKVAAADLNAAVSDVLRFILNPPRVHAYRYAGGDISSQVWTQVDLYADTGAGYDTDNMHSSSVNPSRITCNTAGVFEGQANLQHGGVPEPHTVIAALCLNNGGISAARPPGKAGQLIGQQHMQFGFAQQAAVTLSIQFKLRMQIGDYLELGFWQNAGRTLALNTGYWETYIQASLSEA